MKGTEDIIIFCSLLVWLLIQTNSIKWIMMVMTLRCCHYPKSREKWLTHPPIIITSIKSPSWQQLIPFCYLSPQRFSRISHFWISVPIECGFPWKGMNDTEMVILHVTGEITKLFRLSNILVNSSLELWSNEYE